MEQETPVDGLINALLIELSAFFIIMTILEVWTWKSILIPE